MSSVEGEKVIERSCPVKWERIKRKAPVREMKLHRLMPVVSF